ncbi:hypothetical protein, partial [Streptomyces sp. NPDC000851]
HTPRPEATPHSSSEPSDGPIVSAPDNITNRVETLLLAAGFGRSHGITYRLAPARPGSHGRRF